MEWNEFEPLKLNTADELILKAIEGFTEATNSLVDMTLIEKSDLDKIHSKLNTNFQFELILHSKYVNGYSYSLCEIGYGITVYPSSILIDVDIYDEINNSFSFEKKITEIKSEEDLKKILELIFGSSKFKKLVSGLMKIASKQMADF